jgi:hypothetical protein
MLKSELIQLVKKKYPNIKNISKLLKNDLIKLLEERKEEKKEERKEEKKEERKEEKNKDYSLNKDKIKEYIKNCDSKLQKSLEKIFDNTTYIPFDLLISYINENLDDLFKEIIRKKYKRPIFIYKSNNWIIDYIVKYININYNTFKIIVFDDINFNDKRLKTNDIIILADYFLGKNQNYFNYYTDVNVNNLKLDFYVLVPIATDKVRYEIIYTFYNNNNLNKCNLNINVKGINNIKLLKDVLDDNEISLLYSYYSSYFYDPILNNYLIYFDTCISDDYILPYIYNGLIFNKDNLKLLNKKYKTNKQFNDILNNVKYINVINNYNEKYDVINTIPPIDINKIDLTYLIQNFNKSKYNSLNIIKDIINIPYINKYKKANKKHFEINKIYQTNHNLDMNNVVKYIKKSNNTYNKLIQNIYKYTDYISYNLFTSILDKLIDDAVKYVPSKTIYILQEPSNKFKEQSEHSIKYIYNYIDYYYPELKIVIIDNYYLNTSTLKDNDVILLCNDYLISGVSIKNEFYDLINVNKLKLNFYIISSCYTIRAKSNILFSFYYNKNLNRCHIIFNDNYMKLINEINYYLNDKEMEIINKYYYNLTLQSPYKKCLVLFQHLLLDVRDTITPFYYGILLNDNNYQLIKKIDNKYESKINNALQKLEYVNIISNSNLNPNDISFDILYNILSLN